jgi:hypothetical protein
MIVYFLFWASTIFLAAVGGNPPRLLSLAIMVFFVALRYETGFDWPFYKDLHNDLSFDYVLNDLSYFYSYYGIEIGFLLLAGTFAKLTNYEAFQFFNTIIFFYSVHRLSKSVGHKNSTYVLSLCLSFLLLTLVFSTIRQCLAVSLFNIGISIYYERLDSKNRKFWLVGLLLALSCSIQASALIYCLCFVYSNLKIHKTVRNLSLFLISSLLLFTLFNPVLIEGLLGARIDAKVKFYSEVNSGLLNQINVFYLTLLLFALAGLKFAIPQQLIMNSKPIAQLLKFAKVLLIINFVFIPSSIVRDRISYELFIVLCILLSHQASQSKLIFQSGLVVIGVLFSGYSVLFQYTGIVFIPYQNYFVSSMLEIQSDGKLRQEKFFQQFDEKLRDLR